MNVLSKAFWHGFWQGINPAWSAMWLCFWVGHAASKAMHWIDANWWVGAWYPLYQKTMHWSDMIQERFDFDGPWSPVLSSEDLDLLDTSEDGL